MDGHVKPSRTKPSSSRRHRRCRLVSLFSMAQEEEEEEVKKMMVIETRDWSLVVAVVESSSRIRSITWRHFACHHSSSPSQLCVCVNIFSCLTTRPSVCPSVPSVRPSVRELWFLPVGYLESPDPPSFLLFFLFFLSACLSLISYVATKKKKKDDEAAGR